MDIILALLLSLLVPLAFVLYYVLRPVKCPDCGDALPLFNSPFGKTRRGMWRTGHYVCARCGCEMNQAGQKVTADTPPGPFPTFQWALLAVGLLVGAGLVASLIVVGEQAAVAAEPAPVVVAAPPVVEPPQQAPAVAPPVN